MPEPGRETAPPLTAQIGADPEPRGLPTTREPTDEPVTTRTEAIHAVDPATLRFGIFSDVHAATALVCALTMLAVILAGRSLRRHERIRAELDSPHAAPRTANTILIDPAGQLLGILALCLWLAWQVWWLSPLEFEWHDSLPLHICDFGGLVAAIALITGRRLPTTILYFWGIGLSTQAFFTPTVGIGPGATRFWLFWESHTLIVGGALYCVFVRNYRPHFRDLVVAFGCTVLYAAIMLPLDLAYGWNYGYVGPGKPSVPTLIDRLGPWPLRLLPLTLLVLVAFVLSWLPWAMLARLQPRSGARK